jgi:hypothetical protein
VAGAYVADAPGDGFDLDGYVTACAAIESRGGTPVIFPSYGLNSLDDDGWVAALEAIGDSRRPVHRLRARTDVRAVRPHPVARRLRGDDGDRVVHRCQALVAEPGTGMGSAGVRDRLRPEFHVFTGNDLAIDMVMYGSDYLLGLSTFAPEAFAVRDRMWATGDPAFHELNDLLQYLGHFAFRSPVPGYRHDAAMFFQMRGWASSSNTPNGAPQRPASDRAVLADILERLEQWT